LGRLNEAEASFARALSIAPTHIAALCNRALVLGRLGHHDQALDAADRALVLAPDNAQALYLRGKSLFALQRLREAIDSYEHAAQQGHGPATGLFGYCCLLACDWPGAARAAAMLDELPDDGSAVLTPFALLPFAIDPARRLKLLKGFLRSELAGVGPPARVHTQRPGDKIRIAYLSADFGDHAVTNLVAGLFERHDRNRFEIAGLSVGPRRQGVLRDRVAAGCDTFHELGLKTDAEIAAEIAALGPQIIIDLTGYTENARPGVLARRPAPIQVNYLGYLGTMGASYIDYVLADRVVLPFDQQPFYTERIVHLPDCFLVNDKTLAISPATPSRREAGLPPDGLVFCSFNNSYKFQPPVFDIWMRLLRDIDRSVLWLLASNDEAVGNLRREARLRGIDPERLIFALRVEYPDHLARQKLADIFLDTLPYNAGATAAGALWSGVPLLTAVGETFVGRMAASMLQSIGMPELATANLRDYEAMARALATDPARLAAAKEKLGRNRLTHALFDTDRSRRHIEAAYETMWRMHRNGEPPRSFAVAPLEP
jgi:predicted O-linked N-acetylglucosamine transferase (SPINDLY family)